MENSVINILKAIEQRDGVLRPEVVVNDASDPVHPLHDYFNWADDEAAHNWRIHQARTLIMKVKVTILSQTTQAFHNVRVEINKVPVRGYFSTERVLSDKDMLAQVLTRALDELEYWQKKYDNIKELANIINHDAISKLKHE